LYSGARPIVSRGTLNDTLASAQLIVSIHLGETSTRRPDSQFLVSITRYRIVHVLSSTMKSSMCPIAPSLAFTRYPVTTRALRRW
jgi:hypothetical protein